MKNKVTKSPPKWIYLILTTGSLLASGLYFGKVVFIDAATGSILRAIIFGVLGIFWLYMSHRSN